nr:MAG TPA: hypothetical protein [Caudoviricetes sp.]
MRTKEMKIQVPEGYEIDKENSTFENIVFKKEERKLPKKWEDLYEIKGWFVDFHSDVVTSSSMRTGDNVKNRFPTKEEAEACLALAQLCQLRDRYNDGWKPDWEDSYVKYILYYWGDDITKTHCTNARTLLSFKTQKLRDEFLENFRDLIETAKPLL